jgi:hypothetical protein
MTDLEYAIRSQGERGAACAVREMARLGSSEANWTVRTVFGCALASHHT